MSYIETKTEGQKLLIQQQHNTQVNYSNEVIIHVYTPKLTSIELSSNGSIITDSLLQTKSLEIIQESSGTIDLNLQTELLEIRSSGKGPIHLKGQANKLLVKNTGRSKIAASDLNVEGAAIELLGRGDAEVNSSDSLYVDIMGRGDLYYKGNPKITTKITGSGKVSQVE